ncbi:MAG: acyl carrier protein [Candidatus Sericytochromatia bacterium]
MNKQKLDTEAMFQKIASRVSEQLGVTLEKVNLESHYLNDLGADSLDLMELMMAIEQDFQEYDLAIPDEEAEKLLTIKDTIDYIEKYIG